MIILVLLVAVVYLLFKHPKSTKQDQWSIKKWEIRDNKKGFWAVIEKDQVGQRISYLWHSGGVDRSYSKSGKAVSLEAAKETVSRILR